MQFDTLISYRREYIIQESKSKEEKSSQEEMRHSEERKKEIINNSEGTISKQGNREFGGGENKRIRKLPNQK